MKTALTAVVPRLSPRAMGVLTLGVSISVMVGWVNDWRPLVGWISGDSPMVMNMAVCAAMGGIALVAAASNWRILATVCSTIMALLTAGSLAQDLTNRSFGLNQLFWLHQWEGGRGVPGGAEPVTACGFLLLAVAFFILANRMRVAALVPLIAAVVLALGILPLTELALMLSGFGRPDSAASPWSDASGAICQTVSLPALACLGALALGLLGSAHQHLVSKWRVHLPLGAAFGLLLTVGMVNIGFSRENAVASGNREAARVFSGRLHRIEVETMRLQNEAVPAALAWKLANLRANLLAAVIDAPVGLVTQLAWRAHAGEWRAVALKGASSVAELAVALRGVRDACDGWLGEVEAESRALETRAGVVMAGGGLCSFALLAVALLVVWRETRERERAEARLKAVNLLWGATLDGEPNSV